MKIRPLLLVLGKGGSGDDQAAGESRAEEEMIETYERLKAEAKAAVSELEDLESEGAPPDTEIYQQELALLVEKAAEYVIYVAEEYEELYREYAELYDYIYDYYTYLEELTMKAVSQIEYLKSVAPTLEEMEQIQILLERIENLPAQGQFGQLSSQLEQRAQQALAGLEGVTAPESMQAYGQRFNEAVDEIKALAGSVAQDGQAGFASLSQQMEAAIAGAQQQLGAAVESSLSAFTSNLSYMQSGVEALLKKGSYLHSSIERLAAQAVSAA